jgi:hypothetical protein
MFFASIGAHAPYVTGVVTFGPCMASAWRMASWLSRVIVGLRMDAWVAELAAKHGIAAETLEPFVRALQ